MRARNVLTFALSFVLAVAVLAQGEKSVAGAGGRAAVPMPAADLKWTDLDPAGAPGVTVADLWGNHGKGAFGAFLSFRRDSRLPFTRTPTT